MASTASLVSRQNADGSVDAWVNGWHVHFWADGGKPTTDRHDPAPPDPAPPDPAPPGAPGITMAPYGDGVGVRLGSWIVALVGETAVVIPVKPTGGGGGGGGAFRPRRFFRMP